MRTAMDDTYGFFGFSKRNITILGLILLVTAITYFSSLKNGFVNFDDPLLVYENSLVTSDSWQGTVRAFRSYDPELYIPLTLVSYQIEHRIFGLHPLPYHLTNLLLHLANVFLVFCLIRLLAKNDAIGLLTAAVFAVHPINTETVAWISGRKDLLSTIFALLSVTAYIVHLRAGTKRWYAVSIIAFLLALLSKVTPLTLVLLLPLIDWREGRLDTKTLLRTLPFAIISLLFLVIALYGKSPELVQSSAAQKLLLSGKSILWGGMNVVYPLQLSVMYPFAGAVPQFSIESLIAPALAIAAVAFLVAKNTALRGIGFAFAAALITFLPNAANFSKGGSIYIGSDRYLYMPLIAVFALGSAGILLALQRIKIPPKQALSGTLIALALACCPLAYGRSLVWNNSETFNQAIIDLYPDEYRARYNLGLAYQEEGKDDEALQEYARTLALHPDHANSYINSAIILGERKQFAQAEGFLQKLIAIRPDLARAQYTLGTLYQRQARWDEAQSAYEKATVLDPQYTDAHFSLAQVYAHLGLDDKAKQELRIVATLEPELMKQVRDQSLRE